MSVLLLSGAEDEPEPDDPDPEPEPDEPEPAVPEPPDDAPSDVDPPPHATMANNINKANKAQMIGFILFMVTVSFQYEGISINRRHPPKGAAFGRLLNILNSR